MSITRYYVRAFMFLFPLLFLPVVIDSFGMGKTMLVLGLGLVGLLMWSLEMIIKKENGLKFNKAFGMLLLLVVWAWVGWYRLPEGVRMRSLTDFVGMGAMMAVLIWSFLWLQVNDKEERRKQLNWLTGAGVVITIASLVVFLIPVGRLPITWPTGEPLVSIGETWSLTGSLLSEVILLAFLVVTWGKRLANKLKSEDSGYVIEAIMMAVLTLALMLGIFRIVKTGWVNLDMTSAWAVAVETFKRSPIWGVGPGNFIEAFNFYRPASYNLTSTWANGFLHSNSGILNLWTELGAVAMVILGMVISWVLKLKKNFDFGVILMMGVVALFLPVNLVGLMLLAWTMMMLSGEGKRFGLTLKVGDNGFNVAPWVMVGLLLMGVVYGGYWSYRILAGDITMRQSLLAAGKNDGGGTYNLQIKAIGLNPTLAEYRRVYSQTNLALAKTLLVNENLSDEDKEKASTLIQQSVREAKSAIALDENNPMYWSNLAAIYRDLVGVVDGAADWSFQAYQQAAVFDPSNPVIKLELGGLLYAAERYDEADRVFEQVVSAKPDFANGWYNWAYSAKKMNRLGDAVQRMQQAVALVPVTSGDFEAASKDLTEWKKELDAAIAKNNEAAAAAAAEAAKPETLKAPQALPTTTSEERVDVPADQLGVPTPAAPQPTETPEISPTP